MWQRRGVEHKSSGNGKQRGARWRGSRRPRLEPLEGRILLATDVWTGLSKTSDAWSDRFNWKGNIAPLSGDTVVFNSSNSHQLTSTVDPSYANTSFTLQIDNSWGGTLNLGTSFTLTENSSLGTPTINLQGATLTNAGVLVLTNGLGSTTNLEGRTNTGGSLGGTLINQGTITQQGGDLFLFDGVRLENQAGATYDFAADGNLVASAMSNAGTVEKTAGTGTSSIQAAFSNLKGTLAADSGTLQLHANSAGGVSTGGTLNVARGGHARSGGRRRWCLITTPSRAAIPARARARC
jgi:hypothetical protein